jgi:uncharacterized protein YndB with AHSA1/START domain
VTALADLKTALEEPMGPTEFVYTTYINATAEQVWRGLTEPAFTLRYWGAELRSDWRVGSPVLWKEGDGEFRDLEQVVLESDPYRRLSYSWHNYQPGHAAHFGWSAEEFAELVKEKRSKVTFEIEPRDTEGRSVRLTVIHDDFVPDSKMYRAVSGQLDGSGGWPQLVADLKSLLEGSESLSATR